VVDGGGHTGKKHDDKEKLLCPMCEEGVEMVLDVSVSENGMDALNMYFVCPVCGSTAAKPRPRRIVSG